jgi:hypothetical protein
VSPLLYIILMAAVLLLIIYVALTAIDSPRRLKRVWPDNNLKFETGQELFQYAPSLGEENTLDIQPQRSGRILVTWKVSPLPEADLSQLAIRIYDSSRPDSFYELEAHNWHGKLSFMSKAGVAYYIAVGVKSDQEFTPLLLSAPVVGGGKTLLH